MRSSKPSKASTKASNAARTGNSTCASAPPAATFWFNPDMQVTYWPRGTWSKIAQQFWATGIWRAELVRRYGGQNSIRYFAPPVLVLGMGAAVLETLLQLSGTTKKWPKFLRRFTSLIDVPSFGYIAGILATASAAKGIPAAGNGSGSASSCRPCTCAGVPDSSRAWSPGPAHDEGQQPMSKKKPSRKQRSGIDKDRYGRASPTRCRPSIPNPMSAPPCRIGRSRRGSSHPCGRRNRRPPRSRRVPLQCLRLEGPAHRRFPRSAGRRRARRRGPRCTRRIRRSPSPRT